ncbi:hypothetical protein HA466_0044490 [Hirschfeldia incana]|nr:hypothetical protein HA466_0044490 [Hirschfeldia incana]
MTTDEMNRNESYVINISGDHLYQPSSESVSSPSNSSIGRDSDEDDDGEDNEAESSPYKGPLDLMEALEEVLPVRKGISNYYNGKSKSFTNLAEDAASASSSSMIDLAKPENPYTRRRRNLLCHQIWEKSKTMTPRGKISKKHIMSASKSALTLAVVVAAGKDSSSGGDSSTGTSPTTTGSPPRQMMLLPPLYPGSQGSFGNMKSSQSLSTGFCAWRSCSVADIPRCLPATANGIGYTDS